MCPPIRNQDDLHSFRDITFGVSCIHSQNMSIKNMGASLILHQLVIWYQAEYCRKSISI